jgi:undecaprenyl-diphosphatase
MTSGVVFVNPHSGGGNDIDEFREQFAAHEVIECAPDDLAEQVRRVLERSVPPAFVGVAGGDGTIRGAVEVLLDVAPSTPLLAVPAGTRNHFARDLGIDDVDLAVKAATGGTTRTIDVADVNDAVFVNNASIGVYPRLVAHREARESRMPKGLAAIVAAWHQLRRGRKVMVKVDGTIESVWAVFVGNNCYGESLRELSGRERLDEGVLDVRLTRANARLSRLRIVSAVLFGRLDRSPLIDRRACTTVTLEVAGSTVGVALDGEVTQMTSPLKFESRPGALTVMVSDSHP